MICHPLVNQNLQFFQCMSVEQQRFILGLPGTACYGRCEAAEKALHLGGEKLLPHQLIKRIEEQSPGRYTIKLELTARLLKKRSINLQSIRVARADTLVILHGIEFGVLPFSKDDSDQSVDLAEPDDEFCTRKRTSSMCKTSCRSHSPGWCKERSPPGCCVLTPQMLRISVLAYILRTLRKVPIRIVR